MTTRGPTYKRIILIFQPYFMKKYFGIWGHMEAKDLSFHMGCSSLMCSKRLQSDRPKCRGMLVEMGPTQAKTGRKTTVLQRGENKGCLHLSVCHLDICQNWSGCHTSFERGHSGLSTDKKIQTVVQLIGILWYIFEVGRPQPTYLNIFVCHCVTS